MGVTESDDDEVAEVTLISTDEFEGYVCGCSRGLGAVCGGWCERGAC